MAETLIILIIVVDLFPILILGRPITNSIIFRDFFSRIDYSNLLFSHFSISLVYLLDIDFLIFLTLVPYCIIIIFKAVSSLFNNSGRSSGKIRILKGIGVISGSSCLISLEIRNKP